MAVLHRDFASRSGSAYVRTRVTGSRAPNVLGVSCEAGPACRSLSGAAVAATDVRRTEWRAATAVTPSRWRRGRQLGCRAEAGPHQLHTKVGRRLQRLVFIDIYVARRSTLAVEGTKDVIAHVA